MVKNFYRQLGSTVCWNPREVTVENNFLMNAITHFFQPPAYVFFILLDFWGHRFAAFQKTAEIDFELRGRHVGKPHYVLRVRKICVRPTTAKHLLRNEYACNEVFKKSEIWSLSAKKRWNLFFFYFLYLSYMIKGLENLDIKWFMF